MRFVGNRSSGRMGFALASEATRRGARVTVVAGPTSVAAPDVHEVVRVRSAREMHRAVLQRAADADVVIMAAAVADYTPATRLPQKVAKDTDTLTLVLERTPDILAELGRARAETGRGPLLVGFAAETEDVLARAAAKRSRKHADLMVANDVSRSDAGFDVDANEVTLMGEDGAETLPLGSKARVAAGILDRVERLLQHARESKPASWTPTS